jgi:hypothetical protein
MTFSTINASYPVLVADSLALEYEITLESCSWLVEMIGCHGASKKIASKTGHFVFLVGDVMRELQRKELKSISPKSRINRLSFFLALVPMFYVMKMTRYSTHRW